MPLIPIFISSTFRDFHAERDVLTTDVRARLDDALADLGCRVAMVDLRWGVETSDLEDDEERQRRVFDVCLTEIDRCQPLFVGLVGGRYGWTPPAWQAERAAVSVGLDADAAAQWSITEFEFEYGAFRRDGAESVFFLRDFLGQAPDAWLDPDVANVERLRDRVQRTARERICRYSIGDAEGRGVELDRATFADMSTRVLEPIVRARAAQLVDEGLDAYEAAERLFIEDRTNVLVGRDQVTSDLARGLANGPSRVCLLGPSGVGKSAVWSAVVVRLRDLGVPVVTFAVGAAPDTTSEAAVVGRLLSSLGVVEERLEEIEVRRYRVFEALDSCPGMVLAIDALDALDAGQVSTDLPFLVGTSDKASVICTTTREDHAMLLRNIGFEILEVGDVAPADIAGMIRALAAAEHRTLPAEVLRELSEGGRSALWCQLAVAELVGLGEQHFAALPDGAEPIAAMLREEVARLPPTAIGLAHRLVSRNQSGPDGPLLQSILSLLVASRSGLTIDDLASIDGVPVVAVANIRRRLAAMLVSTGREGRLRFRHTVLRQAARDLFELDIGRAHHRLVDHLSVTAESGEEYWAELAYHTALARDRPIPREYLDRTDSVRASGVARGFGEAIVKLGAAETSPASRFLVDLQPIDDAIVGYLNWWLDAYGRHLLGADLRRQLASELAVHAEALCPQLSLPNRAVLLTGLWRLKRMSEADYDYMERLTEPLGQARSMALATTKVLLVEAMIDCGERRSLSKAILAEADQGIRELQLLSEAMDSARSTGSGWSMPSPEILDTVKHLTLRTKLLSAQLTIGVATGLGTKSERRSIVSAIEHCRSEAMKSAPGAAPMVALASALCVAAEFFTGTKDVEAADRYVEEASRLVDLCARAKPTLQVQLLVLRTMRAKIALQTLQEDVPDEVARELLARASSLVRANPGCEEGVLLIAWAAGCLASIRLGAGDHTEAKRLSDEELRYLESLGEDASELVTVRLARVEALDRASEIYEGLGHKSDARSYAQAAYRLREQIQKEDPSRSFKGMRRMKANSIRSSLAESSTRRGRLIRYESRAKCQIAVDELAERGEAALEIGELERAMGLLNEARERLEESLRADSWPSHEANDYRVRLFGLLCDAETKAGNHLAATECLEIEVAARREQVQNAKRSKDVRLARSDLGLALLRLAHMHRRNGRDVDGLEAATEATALLREAMENPPDDFDYQPSVIDGLWLCGDLQRHRSERTALLSYVEASGLLRKLVAGEPDRRDLRRSLSRLLDSLARVATPLDESAVALTAAQEAYELDRRDLADDPTSASLLRDACNGARTLAASDSTSGQGASSAIEATQLAARLTELVLDQASVDLLVRCVKELTERSDLDVAQVRRVEESLSSMHGDANGRSGPLASKLVVSAFELLSQWYGAHECWKDAARTWRVVVSERQQAFADVPSDQPGSVATLRPIADALVQLADSLRKSGDESLTQFRRAAEIYGQLLAIDPYDWELGVRTARSLAMLGDCASAEGLTDQILWCLRETLDMVERVRPEIVMTEIAEDEFARTLNSLGVDLLNCQLPQLAADAFESSSAIYRQRLEGEPGEADKRLRTVMTLSNLGEALVACRRTTLAAQALLEATALYCVRTGQTDDDERIEAGLADSLRLLADADPPLAGACADALRRIDNGPAR